MKTMSEHINWFCTECPGGRECEVRHAEQKQNFEARHCPENIKAVWYKPNEKLKYVCLEDGTTEHLNCKLWRLKKLLTTGGTFDKLYDAKGNVVGKLVEVVIEDLGGVRHKHPYSYEAHHCEPDVD